MLKNMDAERQAAPPQRPEEPGQDTTGQDATEQTAQGGLPNEYSAGDPAPVADAGPDVAAELDAGTLAISGVNAGPSDSERRNLTPTEERARLAQSAALQAEERAPVPEADPQELEDRGD